MFQNQLHMRGGGNIALWCFFNGWIGKWQLKIAWSRIYSHITQQIFVSLDRKKLRCRSENPVLKLFLKTSNLETLESEWYCFCWLCKELWFCGQEGVLNEGQVHLKTRHLLQQPVHWVSEGLGKKEQLFATQKSRIWKKKKTNKRLNQIELDWTRCNYMELDTIRLN